MFFDQWKVSAVDSRKLNEALHGEAFREMESGLRRDGLWAMAFIEGEGDEKKTRAAYLKQLVQSMRDEAFLVASLTEALVVEGSQGSVQRTVDPVVSVLSNSVEKIRAGSAWLEDYKVVAKHYNGRLDVSGFWKMTYTLRIGDSVISVKTFEDLKPLFLAKVIS